MAGLNEAPRGNRIHVAFFGLRNAGKSTLVNAFTGQQIAIVSDVPGTTTDPVSKAMEILPLGPCLVTDTAGLDDVGELGKQRVERTLKVLETTDIAVWVWGKMDGSDSDKRSGDRFPVFAAECRKCGTVVIEYRRGDSVEELKKKIAAVKLEEKVPGLLDGLVRKGDRVLCVVPIDESAPKGRLILPQQQVIRECLDKGIVCTICQPEALVEFLSWGVFGLRDRLLIVTDSQAFGRVTQTLRNSNTQNLKLTSFSILFARQKGNLGEYARGLKAIKELKDGDAVLVAEGCTHHRQCNDIGAVKIPKALEKLSGRKLKFEFASGGEFELNRGGETPPPQDDGVLNIRTFKHSNISLVVHCGGCMLTRREMQRRIAQAKEAGVPIVNYGLVLAMANGVGLESLEGLGSLGGEE